MRKLPFELRYRNIEVEDIGEMPGRNVEALAKLISFAALRKLQRAEAELEVKKRGGLADLLAIPAVILKPERREVRTSPEMLRCKLLNSFSFISVSPSRIPLQAGQS